MKRLPRLHAVLICLALVLVACQSAAAATTLPTVRLAAPTALPVRVPAAATDMADQGVAKSTTSAVDTASVVPATRTFRGTSLSRLCAFSPCGSRLPKIIS
jgi:hypothetical protein